ncbi:MAG TPA: LuxR family transcriptional regulator [Candidatus Kapabacteria bacterium]|jgi:tetratricopeptide (TPR) repeat protein/DNA-binding CsgD family transcriptional regulator|nr:LuxR family transcriptional regulator [Ignavibacteria bacterium]HRK58260.1 LuxR family transcriptional regulator [Candidatus Kapabacteria bacterium]
MKKSNNSNNKHIYEEIHNVLQGFLPLNAPALVALEKLLTDLYITKDTKSLEYYLHYIDEKILVNEWTVNDSIMTTESVEAVRKIYEYVEMFLDFEKRSTYLTLFSIVIGQCSHIEYVVYLSNVDGIKNNDWRGSQLSYAVALNAVANGYNKLGFSREAYKFALEAVTAARKCENVNVIAGATHTLAIVAYESGDYTEAEQWYYEAMDWTLQQNDYLRVAKIKLNLAKLLYFTKQSYDQALVLLSEARSYFQEYNDISYLQDCECEIGQVYCYMNDKDNALSYTEKAITLAREFGNKRALIYSLCNLAFVYARFEMLDKSLDPLLESLSLLKEHPHLVSERKVYYLLYQISYARQDYKNAYEYLHNYVEVVLLMKDEATSLAATRYKAVYELEKAHYENQLLRVKTEKLEQEIEYKTKELTSLALRMAQKNEVMGVLLDKIDTLHSIEINNVNDLRSQIISSMTNDRGWDYFEKQFKLVHFDFIERLSRMYPTLSPSELKVCALMKINLTTKEMSNVLCQSERSIETYRYRIRKKINLSSDRNLVTYLFGL